ncbi:hypothetical protein ING2D1G_0706 [Peptoniphilus sp. ING2-D1G]|nr:hypothetical protein ING2D1G_0706 [Peptoniphilus sp. ING2-D1G]
MMFDFKDLVESFSTGVIEVILKTEGYYDMNNGGEWVDGALKKIRFEKGAIVPLSNDDLKFDAGGTYNHDNRKLYCYEKLEKGTIVTNTQENGVIKTYKVLAEKDYSDFDLGLYIYILERGDRDDKESS